MHPDPTRSTGATDAIVSWLSSEDARLEGSGGQDGRRRGVLLEALELGGWVAGVVAHMDVAAVEVDEEQRQGEDDQDRDAEETHDQQEVGSVRG